MGRSQESFNKKDREKKKQKKKQDKADKKEERKATGKNSNLDDMMAYVDEHGNIVDTPPDPTKKKKIDASSIEIGVPKREESDAISTRTGQVEFFNDEKGYGFVKDLDTQEKFFMHISGMIDEAREGQRVTFELERGPKGLNAVQVKKA